YHPKHKLADEVQRALRGADWEMVDDWASPANPVVSLLERLGFIPEIGLRTQIQILRRKNASAFAPEPTRP
ncbi:MAG: hypothetical protein N3A66_07930, partial [Planctomycetota bacterium]|nr:hypothetical protein [Planctomycetota bacterium]